VQEDSERDVRDHIDSIYRSDSRRFLATLIRLLGDFDLAEEALHDAFAAALESWPKNGLQTNPRTWLISTGRFKAIDRLRRTERFDSANAGALERLVQTTAPEVEEGVEDDRLRLIFTCCHPALSADARIALTLRETRAPMPSTTEYVQMVSAVISAKPTARRSRTLWVLGRCRARLSGAGSCSGRGGGRGSGWARRSRAG